MSEVEDDAKIQVTTAQIATTLVICLLLWPYLLSQEGVRQLRHRNTIIGLLFAVQVCFSMECAALCFPQMRFMHNICRRTCQWFYAAANICICYGFVDAMHKNVRIVYCLIGLATIFLLVCIRVDHSHLMHLMNIVTGVYAVFLITEHKHKLQKLKKLFSFSKFSHGYQTLRTLQTLEICYCAVNAVVLSGYLPGIWIPGFRGYQAVNTIVCNFTLYTMIVQWKDIQFNGKDGNGNRRNDNRRGGNDNHQQRVQRRRKPNDNNVNADDNNDNNAEEHSHVLQRTPR